MRSFIESILDSIKEFFKKLSRKEKIRLAILAVVIISLGITVAAVLGRTTYAALYSGMSADVSGQVYTLLQEWGEDVKAEGTTIMVPEGKVDELRMRLNAEGFQTTGFDYSTYDPATGFGATDYEKQLYSTWTMEGKVRTQLMQMSKIKDCLVQLSLPKDSPFVLSQTSDEARASVTLVLEGGASLSQEEVNAVADTVINAVPGLTYERMTIADSNMRLYRLGDSAELDGNLSLASQIELERQVELATGRQVENLLSAVFGAGSVQAMAQVKLNFDDIVSEAIEFAPPVAGEDGGIPVSMSELYEASRLDGEAQGIPGTDSNGMGAIEYPWGTLEEGELYEKVLREINYEINKTTTQIKQAKGKMIDLSISVLIDSEAVAEDYTPNVINLVANAVGVDEGRITVERMPFKSDNEAQDLLDAQAGMLKAIATRDLLKTIITWGMVALLVIAVLLFIRSILKSGRPAEQDAELVTVGAAAAQGKHVDYMASEEVYTDTSADFLKEIELNAKPENVANLEKFIDKDAATVAQLLRNWLADD